MVQKTKFAILTICLIFYSQSISAQDSVFIKVHFLYGSKPKRQFKDSEKKWFGGKYGGHAGIETDSNKVLNFLPIGKFHYLAKKQNFHSHFAVHSLLDFWDILGNGVDEVKKTTILIPISNTQKIKLDSINKYYLENSPYNYAFIGMRCGSAVFDILGQLGILKKYSHKKLVLKIFYPKKLRKKLLKKAKEYNWKVLRQEGITTRIWEKD